METIEKQEFIQEPPLFPAKKKYFWEILSVTHWVFILVLAGGMFGLGWQQANRSSSHGTLAEAPIPLQKAIIQNTQTPQDVVVDFGLFWKVWNLVREKHIDRVDLDAKKMLYGAINGMLSASGDPYTNFFDPEENKQFTEMIDQTFDGIGAEMGMKERVLIIVAPLDDSPAQKAGLMAGDAVLKIDGVDTSSLTLDEDVARIRGPKGTDVTLTIFRSGDNETKDIVVKRDKIQVKSVKFEMKSDGIAWIRISQFGEQTTTEFATAVKRAMGQNTKAIIVDVRNDPGGLLISAVDIAGYFLPNKSPVVIEENSDGKRETLNSSGNPSFGSLPIVVLIDGGSASASEILAGALKDNASDRVTLVGTKSFGKGSVQERIPVTGDTSVKITVAHWLTPSGKQINKLGITPDIEVSITPDDIANKKDPQLAKAIEILTEKIGK